MDDPFENCVWEELTAEQLKIRLEPEAKRNQDYLAKMRSENTNPKHSYEDTGRYMILYVDRSKGRIYDDIPPSNFTLKSYVYPDDLQKLSEEYYIDSIGHIGKGGSSDTGMWLKTKRKKPE